MLRGTLVGLLSLSLVASSFAAPVAIPFTGLSADIHMKRESLIPVISIKDVQFEVRDARPGQIEDAVKRDADPAKKGYGSKREAGPEPAKKGYGSRRREADPAKKGYGSKKREAEPAKKGYGSRKREAEPAKKGYGS